MAEVGQERGWGQLRGIDTLCRLFWRGMCDDFGNTYDRGCSTEQGQPLSLSELAEVFEKLVSICVS